jgi:hypothetical protein
VVIAARIVHAVAVAEVAVAVVGAEAVHSGSRSRLLSESSRLSAPLLSMWNGEHGGRGPYDNQLLM